MGMHAMHNLTYRPTCMAPLDIISSQSLLEWRTRLLNAPAALALVLSSSPESRLPAS